MNILVLGASGLLGQALFRGIGGSNKVFGTIRDKQMKFFFPADTREYLLETNNIFSMPELGHILEKFKIEVVVNCISVSNIYNQSEEVMNSIFVKFPHDLGALCSKNNIRVIQISSDGVFSGACGNYLECDDPDPSDLYGTAKLEGELDGPNQITIRTSIIGHDPIKKNGLLEWFLLQKEANLYSNYIFSGITTNEFALIIREYILNNADLEGIYHIASSPISKYDLLKLVSEKYHLKNTIIKDDSVKIDRSLSALKFLKDTGYSAPTWQKLIQNMKEGSY
jgi:dTDP-4-dehydrorhamnose reductase